MARITVEDCLDHVDNRFSLVMVATRRARQLSQGVDPLVPGENDKPTVLALREIAGGLINYEMLDAQDAASEDERLEIPFTFSNEGSSDL